LVHGQHGFGLFTVADAIEHGLDVCIEVELGLGIEIAPLVPEARCYSRLARGKLELGEKPGQLAAVLTREDQLAKGMCIG